MEHELGRRLDQGPVVLPGVELGAGENRAHQRLHVVLAAPERVRQALDISSIRLGGDEMSRDLVRNVNSGRWLPEDAFDHPLRVKRAGFAEKRDGAVDCALGVEYPRFL